MRVYEGLRGYDGQRKKGMCVCTRSSLPDPSHASPAEPSQSTPSASVPIPGVAPKRQVEKVPREAPRAMHVAARQFWTKKSGQKEDLSAIPLHAGIFV